MKAPPRLYAITKGGGIRGELIEAVRAAAEAGAPAVQLREKDLEARELFDLARLIVGQLDGFETDLFVNERAPSGRAGFSCARAP